MEKIEKIKTIADVAQSQDIANIDWDSLPIKKEEAFLIMATNVYEQINSLEDKDKLPVAMAMMTKLMVENFASDIKRKESDV